MSGFNEDGSVTPPEGYREAVARESEVRDRASTGFTVAECKRSGNPKVCKVAGQYELGVITYAEFEAKVRELMKGGAQ